MIGLYWILTLSRCRIYELPISQRVLYSMNDAIEEFMLRQGMAFAILWQRSVWHNMSRQASETCVTWAALAVVEAHVLYIVHFLDNIAS